MIHNRGILKKCSSVNENEEFKNLKTPRSTRKRREINEEHKWFLSTPDDPPKNWWTILNLKGSEGIDEVNASMKKIVLAMHPDKLDPDIQEKGKKYFQHWNKLKKGLNKPNWRERISGFCLCDEDCKCYGCVNRIKCSCGQPQPPPPSFSFFPFNKYYYY